ncbi:replication factor C subunit 3-like [Tasmannia lanceolata]|uniref:replication factor C subunit 3-like n=1 Tax=Tasmannia lanceolata TaxID=3420 RepID=UPI004063CD7E
MSNSSNLPTPRPSKTLIHRPVSVPNISRPPSIPSSTSSSSSSSLSRKKTNSKSRKSVSTDLTQQSLEEFNRRNNREAKRNYDSSRDYNGLTDSALRLNRIKGGGPSPSRESRGTAVTSGSFSSVFVRIQSWGFSCFKAKVDPTNYSSNSKSLEFNSKENKEEVIETIEKSECKPLRERIVSFQTDAGHDLSSLTCARPMIMEKGKNFIWADKYRPKALKDFICNRDKAQLLQTLVAHGLCNHYIFEGLPGVGKRTMVWALLKEAFGPENLKTREELRQFQLKGEVEPHINVNLRVSSKHVEANLSEMHGYERQIIVQLIKETQDTDRHCDHTNCRVIVLYRADKLSTDAQHYLRWVLERYRSCNKIIFCCSDVFKLQTIRNLCMPIQLQPPSNNEIVEVLQYIAKQEGIELPHHLAVRIAENSKQNLRQAIRSFEASWQLNYLFTEDQVIVTGWEEDIANIAKSIIDEQSPQQLYFIRGKLQKFIEHNVSPEFIFSTLVGELKKHLEDHFGPKIDALYLEYNRDNGFILDGENSVVLLRRQQQLGKRNNDPMRMNVHHFMRIEEFTAKFMSFYKSSIKNNLGRDNGYES